MRFRADLLGGRASCSYICARVTDDFVSNLRSSSASTTKFMPDLAYRKTLRFENNFVTFEAARVSYVSLFRMAGRERVLVSKRSTTSWRRAL